MTKRELSVVQLVAEGLSNRDISHELRLSEHTVRNYLFRIFNKVGVSTRLGWRFTPSISETQVSIIQPPAIDELGGTRRLENRMTSVQGQPVAK